MPWLLILLTSHGIPMLLAGDEAGRTQHGNNNAYCHDDELSWFDWTLVERNAELVRFTRHLIAFRRAHPCLRRRRQPTGRTQGLFPDVSWHGVRAWTPDWSPHSRVFAAMLCARDPGGADDCVYVAANAHWEPHELQLPALPPELTWHRFADTGAGPGADSHAPGTEPPLPRQDSVRLAPRSSAVLLARPGPAAAQPHEE
ncbi:hypothetical protein [Amycolatopsis vancoresmycina]|uniref:hypothetical protein n=1 Tax=Amycolatopsis vancoresmycina TaxID=208444 RepID=UPI003B846D54